MHALALVWVCSARVQAQTALGPEFRLNSYTTFDQHFAKVSSDAAGNFVAVWLSDLRGIVGQRFSSSGAQAGSEFVVRPSPPYGGQASGGVASAPEGDFVVVWREPGSGAMGRRYAASGSPLGTEFVVDGYTTGGPYPTSVASDAAGNFVVVWSRMDIPGTPNGIYARRYASSGSPLAAEFRVNTYTTGSRGSARVASGPAGVFVVVWSGDGAGSNFGDCFAQRYAANGAPLGTEFRLNTFTIQGQGNPAAAFDPGGGFVAVWSSGQQHGVFGQRYANSGAPLGGEFQINTNTTAISQGVEAAVASAPGGGFVVVWNSIGQDAPMSLGIYGQRYSASGAPAGSEFRVNSYTTGNQAVTDAASSSAGAFVVVWHSPQDGNGSAVLAQRYCLQALSSVSVSASGPTSVCAGGTGGVVTVSDSGGGFNGHQWFSRVLPGGSYSPILGETGLTYVIKGSDFPPGNGLYAVVCQTTPSCGSQMISPENVQVTITTADATPPAVTAPPPQTATQTLCQ